MRRYRMPDGRTYQYEEGDAPACAVPVEEVATKKKAVKNKAASPKVKKG